LQEEVRKVLDEEAKKDSRELDTEEKKKKEERDVYEKLKTDQKKKEDEKKEQLKQQALEDAKIKRQVDQISELQAKGEEDSAKLKSLEQTIKKMEVDQIKIQNENENLTKKIKELINQAELEKSANRSKDEEIEKLKRMNQETLELSELVKEEFNKKIEKKDKEIKSLLKQVEDLKMAKISDNSKALSNSLSAKVDPLGAQDDPEKLKEKVIEEEDLFKPSQPENIENEVKVMPKEVPVSKKKGLFDDLDESESTWWKN